MIFSTEQKFSVRIAIKKQGYVPLDLDSLDIHYEDGCCDDDTFYELYADNGWGFSGTISDLSWRGGYPKTLERKQAVEAFKTELRAMNVQYVFVPYADPKVAEEVRTWVREFIGSRTVMDYELWTEAEGRGYPAEGDHGETVLRILAELKVPRRWVPQTGYCYGPLPDARNALKP